jgi:predicted dehydrogenase
MRNKVNRRSALKAITSTGMIPALPAVALGFAGSVGRVVEEVAAPGLDPNAKPKYSVRFSVIGLDHNHIMGITSAVQRGGGELVSVHSSNPKDIADFQRRFPNVKVARNEDEILNDPSIQLICAAPIPDQRAPLGIRAMQHGKDYLCDKPGIITLDQLAEVRKAVQDTGRIFAILFSERLGVKAAVKAGELVKAGAIGRVIQTVSLAPHQIGQPDSSGRPDWFWDPARYGGVLCDIGSHQVDQFVYYTGSTTAEIVSAQVANVNHPDKPKFQDFGDMVLQGNAGVGYVRVDWFTPDGLGTWGDGRQFILGTEGYIELRSYADIAGRKGGNHLFVINRKETRYIDCNQIVLPFGPQFVEDVVKRTHVAQDQQQAFLATELALKAQQAAKKVQFSS